HAHPAVVRAIGKAARLGTTFGAPTAAETDLAELLRGALPSMERIRLVSSGTEACMSAARLARGATGREILVKFDGGYHGHGDAFLVKAGSGAATFGSPDSAGVPAALAKKTAILPYNDLLAARKLFARSGRRIAAVIVEPVAGNMGVVRPAAGFLKGLRLLCDRSGTVLIFDEVISGFRSAWGGAQRLFGVRPDLTCLGKIIGGGLPLAAYGGRADLMARLAPEGPVYQAGTLSGNPVAVAAGLAALRELRRQEKDGRRGRRPYERLDMFGARLEEGLRDAAARAGSPVVINRAGSVLTVFFTDRPVTDFASAKRSDTKRFARFFQAMRAQGILLPPSQFEAWFLSLAHTAADVDRTIRAARAAFRSSR
ncbi:MAG: glutamate-1-semialdehyde 2,1-aminomutase, partial [bacterium]